MRKLTGITIALALLTSCATPEVAATPQQISQSPAPAYTAEERSQYLEDVRLLIPLEASQGLPDDVLVRDGIRYCEMPEAELTGRVGAIAPNQLEFGMLQSASYYLCPERESVYLRFLEAAGIEYRDPSGDAQ